MLLLLLWMHFSLALCAANTIHLKHKTPPIVAESMRTESGSAGDDLHLAEGFLLQKNETSRSALHRSTQVQQIKKKLTSNNLPTDQQLLHMETAPSTVKPAEIIEETSKIDPLTVEI